MNTVIGVALASTLLAQQSQLDIPAQPLDADADALGPAAKDGEVQGTLVWPTAEALRTLAARCSAYSYTGSRTRTGTWPQWGTVAVDPSVIELGSMLRIAEFPGTTFTAEDTGGGVHGAWVDIFMPSAGDALRWGVRPCNVTVLGR